MPRKKKVAVPLKYRVQRDGFLADLKKASQTCARIRSEALRLELAKANPQLIIDLRDRIETLCLKADQRGDFILKKPESKTNGVRPEPPMTKVLSQLTALRTSTSALLGPHKSARDKMKAVMPDYEILLDDLSVVYAAMGAIEDAKIREEVAYLLDSTDGL